MEQTTDFRPETFFHLERSELLVNNAKVGKGWIYSASYMATIPGLENATTPYAFGNHHKDKEEIWESIRATEFADKPTRIKALFVFPSLEDAERAATGWFGGESRTLLEIRIPRTSLLHVADARCLDSQKPGWEDAARSYWRGEITSAPHLEGVVFGAAYVQNWMDL